MQKPENKFRKWFIERLEAHVRVQSPHAKFVAQKHADYASGGVLDMDVAINGYTLWIEFKHLPAVVRGRQLDVSALQAAEAQRRVANGVPALVVLGLGSGGKQGYPVAIYEASRGTAAGTPFPAQAMPNDFGDVETALTVIYSMAFVYAEQSYNAFKYVSRQQL